jgi:periplasmic protein TonB
METKKSSQAELETKRPVFFEIGLIIAMLFVWVAFEWTIEKSWKIYADKGVDVENWVYEELPPLIFEKPEAPEIPEPEKKIKIDFTTEFIEVPDHTDTKEPGEEIPEKKADITLPNPEPEPEITEILPHYRVEVSPTFPGGEEALFKYLNKTKYPEMCRSSKIEGEVHVSFVVNEKGLITDVNIERSPSKCFDEEVLKMMQQMPSWNPGVQQGKKVKVKMHLPFRFKLAR